MKQFPVVKVSGSNYEVGVAIGKQLSAVIQKTLAESRKIFGGRLTGYIEESKLFLAQANTYFPHYVDELRGIAVGAQVNFDELFLSNNREVADFSPAILDPGHCTIIAIPTGDGYLVGHNEDWDAASLEILYLLDAEINGIKIFGLNYANNIIGASVAVNEFGLVEAVNELSHHDAQIGVPKNFVARALLDCKILEDAEKIIRTIPRAAGFNHVLVQGTRVWNIESSAKEYVIEKINRTKYLHTNHYVTELKRIDKGNKESGARYEKVKALLPSINTATDIMRTLSNQSPPRVCREGTIGSVIFDPAHHTAHVAYGQPTSETYKPIMYFH